MPALDSGGFNLSLGSMAEGEAPKEFPDVEQKLAAPKKLSAFEKDRQAALLKEKRAEAENAAALKAFAESFGDNEDEDDSISQLSGGRGPLPGSGGSGGSVADVRRGPTFGALRSGPGRLDSVRGPPPLNLKRKRALDEMREAQEAAKELDGLSRRTHEDTSGQSPYAVPESEESAMEAPRPTLQLHSLPPGTYGDEVRSLVSEHVPVHSVQLLPPEGPGLNVKRSVAAIVTLDANTATAQIEATVSALKNRYLGFGFYLSISRHLSSIALHPSMVTSSAVQLTEPFGAEKPHDSQGPASMRLAAPSTEKRGFAPPESYDKPMRSRHTSASHHDAYVTVKSPRGAETIKAIHTVVDRLLLEPDLERALAIEALLMARPEVQTDERFAFLYDSRSPAGQYYRFCLWAPEMHGEIVTGMKGRRSHPTRIHDDVPIEWVASDVDVAFPDLKSLSEVVTHIDYVSSEEESDDEDADRRFNTGRRGDGLRDSREHRHLNPVQRARLIHLLSRLPSSNAKLRKGDVARITHFAIKNAGGGAEEIVDALLLNVERPLVYSLAAKYEDEAQDQDEEDIYEPDEDLPNLGSHTPPRQHADEKREDDQSNAKLIALYVISDILSASSTAGARNAWKYRQLFEAGFKARKTFEHLGKLDKELSWGKMKTEQWKRRIGVVFGIWEGWSVFSSDVHQELKQSFFEPPLSEEEKIPVEAEADREPEHKKLDRFRRVGDSDTTFDTASPATSLPTVPASQPYHDDAAMDDVDGIPMSDSVDGLPMSSVDGSAMQEDTREAEIGGLDGAADVDMQPAGNTGPFPSDTKDRQADRKPAGSRKRMRAEDMFQDSSDEA